MTMKMCCVNGTFLFLFFFFRIACPNAISFLWIITACVSSRQIITASEAEFKTPGTAMQAAPHHQHAQFPFNGTPQAVSRATGLLGANRAMEDVRPSQREECSVVHEHVGTVSSVQFLVCRSQMHSSSTSRLDHVSLEIRAYQRRTLRAVALN